MSNSPIICFGQQPCGIFPKRFLYAKIQTARRLQKEIGGEIVFFYHDSDHDPRETKTLLHHRRLDEKLEINFTFENKLQRKYSPLYLKRVCRDWYEKTLVQLPAYVDRKWVDAFRETWSSSPSPGTPGEGRGEGSLSHVEQHSKSQQNPHPNPLPEYRERGHSITAADFCLEMYRHMGLVDGMRIVRSSDFSLRNQACDIDEFFVDVSYEGETVRARRFDDGSLKLHEGGNAFITLPACSFTKEQISPTRDSRLKWMQSIIHCTHYVAGAGEQDYLRKQDAPEITYIGRDTIERSDEAYTEIK